MKYIVKIGCECLTEEKSEKEGNTSILIFLPRYSYACLLQRTKLQCKINGGFH